MSRKISLVLSKLHSLCPEEHLRKKWPFWRRTWAKKILSFQNCMASVCRNKLSKKFFLILSNLNWLNTREKVSTLHIFFSWYVTREKTSGHRQTENWILEHTHNQIVIRKVRKFSPLPYAYLDFTNISWLQRKMKSPYNFQKPHMKTKMKLNSNETMILEI